MTDDQLAVEVARAFPELFKDAWKHQWYISSEFNGYKCCKCKCHCLTCEDTYKATPCTVPDPIDVTDANVAMMVRNVLVKEGKRHALKDAMKIVHAKSSGLGYSAADNYGIYFAIYATPADHLRTALEAKGAE